MRSSLFGFTAASLVVAFCSLGMSPTGSGNVAANIRTSQTPDGLAVGEWTSMREQMRAAQYQLSWQQRDGDWAWRAPNREQGFHVAFRAGGSEATGYETDGSKSWRFGLKLCGYGTAAELKANREKVSYRWDDHLTEWYENRPEGVKHGITLSAPPEGATGGRVELTFAIHGSLTPELDNTGQVLRLRNEQGSVVLLYDRLAVFDANGKALPSHFELSSNAQRPRALDVGHWRARRSLGEGGMLDVGRSDSRNLLRISIDTLDAVYPLTVDPLLHRRETILRASDAQAIDQFGYSVAVSGDTLVVGAHDESGGAGDPMYGSGAVYVFERDLGGANNWGEATILRSSEIQANDHFGKSVSICGDTLAVGAWTEDGGPGSPIPYCGAAYVFARNQGGADNWGQVAILRASDAQSQDYFGFSVSISGDTVVVGAISEDGGPGDPFSNCGAAYVFERNRGGADNWGQVRILHSVDGSTNGRYGGSVAISGDTLVIGASNESHGGQVYIGAAYVYERNQGGVDNWGLVTELDGSDTRQYDNFGYSVSISGDTLVVGACHEIGASGRAGSAAYVFERNQGGADNWGEVKILRDSSGTWGDWFGCSVSISGDTLAVGADHKGDGPDDPLAYSGAVYVFARNHGGPDNWGQVEVLRASDAQWGDTFGVSVSISGNTLVVGADSEDGGTGDPLSASGAAYVFEATEGTWQQTATAHASAAQANDYFGYSVDVSSDTLVVGAYNEDGGPGNPLSESGAAYVFTRNEGGADKWGQVLILRASDAQAGDSFGISVSVSGDTLVVGAHNEDGGAGDPQSNCGAAYVFERNQGGADNWGQVQALHAFDAQANDRFGRSVSISGDTLVVGAYSEDGGPGDPTANSGAAYVFERNRYGADNWGVLVSLHASDKQANDFFGHSVSISGDTLVVGAYGEDGGSGDPASSSGAAYVFSRNQWGTDAWGQVKILHALDAQANDRFGYAVSIDNSLCVVGAYNEDGGTGNPAPNSGAAYIFERNKGGVADSWGEIATLRTSEAQEDDYFGISVSISGDVVAIGAYCEDGGEGDPKPNSGAVYLYKRNVGRIGLLRATDAQANDYFGRSVSLCGNTLAVGAYGEDGGTGDPASSSGAAYIFDFDRHVSSITGAIMLLLDE